MTTLRSYMTDDHRRCDDLFAEAEQAIGKGEADRALAAFGQFRAAMLAHFAAEENTLFPGFEAKTGMQHGPTEVMRREHEQLRGLIEAALLALQAADIEDYLGLADTLVILMQQHNLKEENMLYPMCDQHLGAEAPVLLDRLARELGGR